MYFTLHYVAHKSSFYLKTEQNISFFIYALHTCGYFRTPRLINLYRLKDIFSFSFLVSGTAKHVKRKLSTINTDMDKKMLARP